MAKKDQHDWARFSKAELIKTVRALDRRQTKLLNRIAGLEARLDTAYDQAGRPNPALPAVQRYPWETVLGDTVTYEASSGKPQCRKDGV